jgi:hypothetical protein
VSRGAWDRESSDREFVSFPRVAGCSSWVFSFFFPSIYIQRLKGRKKGVSGKRKGQLFLKISKF